MCFKKGYENTSGVLGTVIWKVTFDLLGVLQPTIFTVFGVFGVFEGFLAKNPKNTYFACFLHIYAWPVRPRTPKIMKSRHKFSLFV
jgi:hypothetical protein